MKRVYSLSCNITIAQKPNNIRLTLIRRRSTDRTLISIVLLIGFTMPMLNQLIKQG